MDTDYIIGIDLGTTNTCAGIWRNNNFEIFLDKYGNSTIPSIVAYTNKYLYDKSRYVGLDAKNQLELNYQNTFYEVKRLIGRQFTDPYVSSELECGLLAYNIITNDKNQILLQSELNDSHIFTPEEISGAILLEIKQLASKYLGCKITNCVITVPANFNDYQRQSTKDSAIIAGLNCLRIINEPTAAALAYGYIDKTIGITNEIYILVYDFGGGTLDVSLLSIYDGIFDVIASCGNARFGGSDFDNRIMTFCILKFKQKHKLQNITLNKFSLQKLKILSEKAKINLSSDFKTNISIHNFYNDLSLNIDITQPMFEEICADLLFKCITPIDDILHISNIPISQINDIILVGGMTKSPIIKSLLETKFNKKLTHLINPDLVVAMGASIQGHILTGATDDIFANTITLLDTTSLSLGVETNNGIMDVVINRGSNIPISKQKKYSIDEDFVDSVVIKVFEGERQLTKDNFFVGEFILTGIIPQPRNIPEIIITFKIDNNGLISVIAEDTKTHNKNELIVINNKNKLSDEDLQKLINESQEFELQDEIQKEKKLLHSTSINLCNTILNNIKYNTTISLPQEFINNTNSQLNSYLSYLSEKLYFNYDISELKSLINTIESNYKQFSKYIHIDDTINPQQNNNLTSIYDDSNPESNMITSVLDESPQNVSQFKQDLSNLCNQLLTILPDSDKLIQLKDIISDTLLWIYVNETLTDDDYKYKIDEINSLSNSLYAQFPDIFIYQELEQLCYHILLLIEDHIITNPILINLVNTTLKWLYTCENKSIDEYNSYLQQINSLYDKSSIESNNSNNITDTGGTENSNRIFGTSILSIIELKQKNILNNLINKDD